ncbi:LPS assembly lipoprotein LptE [Albirhodobacter sp. R86504]|uniref:LPS assembly lipoprotein LptE n=1 Tax=Albirhodobacter sp. R86504 TaxID=3093848 RepID=UPI00366C4EFD
MKGGLAICGLVLMGCGFAPAYGPTGGAKVLLGGVATQTPESRDDYTLTMRIADRLGHVTAQRYRLDYEIETDSTGQAVTPENATTRYSLTGTAEYKLVDASTDAVLLNGEVASFTSWSATGSTVATQSAEDDAHERLMVMLADQIVTRLLATASSLPQ